MLFILAYLPAVTLKLSKTHKNQCHRRENYFHFITFLVQLSPMTLLSCKSLIDDFFNKAERISKDQINWNGGTRKTRVNTQSGVSIIEKDTLIIIKTRLKDFLGGVDSALFIEENNMMFTMRKFSREKIFSEIFHGVTNMFYFTKNSFVHVLFK